MDHAALNLLEHGVDDFANITTIGRMGTAIYKTYKNNSSSACLRRGQEVLWDTMDVLKQDTAVIPKDERDSLCMIHDKLQTEGQDIEKLLQQPFKVKHLLTGRALQVKRKAGLFETEALVLQTQTKRTSARYRSKRIQEIPRSQDGVDETAEMTAFDSNAQDIHDTRDLARPDGHDIPLSGNENSPLPGDPNTPPSVAKDLDIPSPNQGTVFAPKHTYPPDAHKSI